MNKNNRLNPELLKLKQKIVRILKKNGVLKAGIFGSYARGNYKKRSDLDILVKTKKGIGLYDFVGIKLDLEKELNKKVDLVEYKTIKPAIKDSILKDEIRII